MANTGAGARSGCDSIVEAPNKRRRRPGKRNEAETESDEDILATLETAKADMLAAVVKANSELGAQLSPTIHATALRIDNKFERRCGKIQFEVDDM